jgi:hypothetical protein
MRTKRLAMSGSREHDDIVKHHIVAIGISKHKKSAAILAFAESDASEFFTLFNQNVSEIGCRQGTR